MIGVGGIWCGAIWGRLGKGWNIDTVCLIYLSEFRCIEYKAALPAILVPIRIIMMFDYQKDDITTNNFSD